MSAQERWAIADHFGHVIGWALFARSEIQSVSHAYENVRVVLRNGAVYLVPKHRGGLLLLEDR